MINFILIFLCISAGVILSKLRVLPPDAHKSVNAWVLYIALPALSLRFVPEIAWNVQLLLPALVPFVVWGGAWLFVRIYDRKKRLLPGSHTALLVTCGLGNTAFIGFPMISAFYGESEIHHAVVIDQITFILFATVGVITILRTSAENSQEITFFSLLKKVFRFPPFIACLAALILSYFIDISAANPLLDKLVATMSPLALFSIGLQLKFGAIKQEWKLVSAGLLYKLILAPCLALMLALVLHSSGNPARISVFEAGMSSHITVSLLAGQYNLNPRYCSLVVGLGIILSFITSTVWYLILR
ncbi:MAG: AEC family transporter [Dysgonamonadaceae bacterium]|jgi:predicted permease|nr:AEC family transporter [Dysgonamonadaceae bacterium]